MILFVACIEKNILYVLTFDEAFCDHVSYALYVVTLIVRILDGYSIRKNLTRKKATVSAMSEIETAPHCTDLQTQNCLLLLHSTDYIFMLWEPLVETL